MLVIWTLNEKEYILFILSSLNANCVAEEINRSETEGRWTGEEPMAVISLELKRVLAVKIKEMIFARY